MSALAVARERVGRGREGVAVVAVLVLLVAVTLLAHGLLLLADLELETSRASASSSVARLEAQRAALDAASDSGSADRPATALWASSDSLGSALSDSVARAAGIASGGGWRTNRMVRLAREIWLAEGRADVAGRARHRAARPYWIADAAARIAAAEAVVVSGDPDSTRIDGVVTSATFRSVPVAGPPIPCDSVLAAVDSLRPAPVPPVLVVPPGTWGPALGRLTLDSLAARAGMGVSGSGTPAPLVVASACVDDPWNWGDPRGGGAACADRFVVVAGAGGTRALGGLGQGLLVLRGGGTLTDLEFHGVVVADGRLILDGATRIVGLVRASGGVVVGPSATVEGSACWAAAALRHPAVRTPSPIPASGWIDGR